MLRGQPVPDPYGGSMKKKKNHNRYLSPEKLHAVREIRRVFTKIMPDLREKSDYVVYGMISTIVSSYNRSMAKINLQTNYKQVCTDLKLYLEKLSK